jgi:4-amino-4-deoxy-L-arabinose transferase-like glycosyltransferase
MAQAKPRAARRKAEAPADRAAWTRRALWLLVALWLGRLALNAFTVIPVHFDEAQYWAYGRELALGHYSKPPLTGWLIELASRLFGDTLFALRFFAPMMHLLIGGLIFLSARRLFDARTGFWAAVIYSLAPGVAISAHLMTTDPVMMSGWALALYALIRAQERPDAAPGWWALSGFGVGLGMLAKYTAIAFPLGLLGYALFSRERPVTPGARRGALIAAGAGLAALSPNLWWNAANGFVTVAHLGENAELSTGPMVNPGELAEFLGAQLGVIGPVAFPAVLAGLAVLSRRDPRTRLLAWLAAPLLIAMSVQAFLSGANANWAAPAYVAGAILAARWLLERDWLRALRAHAALGLAALAVVWGLGGVYAVWATDLPRVADPFKKMRIGGPFCELALTAMEAEGADALASNDRRRLSECLFYGGLDFEDAAIWDPDGAPSNHFEFRSRLEAGDDRLMVLALNARRGTQAILSRFETAQPLGEGRFATHSDRAEPWSLWLVQGFRGYPDAG